MSILRFYKNYNNYFNRIVKNENYAAEFEEYDPTTFTDMNFNENDGVYTTHIINWDKDYSPDYLTVIKKDVHASPSILKSGFIRMYAMDSLDVETWEFETLTSMAEARIYDPENLKINLEAAVAYNSNTDPLRICFYGSWRVKDFSFKLINEINPNTEYQIKIVYGLDDTITIYASTIKNYYNGIVGKTFFKRGTSDV